MNVAVVDPDGNLVPLHAWTARNSRRSPLPSIRRAPRRVSSSDARLRGRDAKFGFNYVLTLDDVIASRGGIPLVEGGKIIGAVGCSGGTGSQDEAICTAAVDTFNK